LTESATCTTSRRGPADRERADAQADKILVEPQILPAPSRREGLAILRGQLTLLRRRAEQGIPVSVESIARAEVLARSLETVEVST
jgi:hypothetical protein